MSGIEKLFTQTLSLETYLGNAGYGEQFADPVDVACYIEDSVTVVRNAQGDETVSTAKVFAAMATAPSEPPVQGQFSPGSQVTRNGRTTFVLSTARFDGAGPARIHHVEVALA